MSNRHFRESHKTPKLRMYQKLWLLIAQNTSDKPVEITCPVGNHKRVIQAVRKEKSIANKLRKNVEAVSYGELIVTTNGNKIFFSLDWNGDMI